MLRASSWSLIRIFAKVQVYQFLKAAFQARLLHTPNVAGISAQFKELIRERSIDAFGLKPWAVRCWGPHRRTSTC